MKKAPGLVSCFLIAIGLVSCNLPVQVVDGAGDQGVVGQYQTVSVLLTETSQAVVLPEATLAPATRQPQAEITLLFTADAPEPTMTDTPVSFTAQGEAPGGSNTPLPDVPAVPCDLARAGMPFDVTIPDDTRVSPGEYFSKTWRLVNAGNCNWDQEYGVVWFSGDELGLVRALSFNGVVAVGQSVDITVDMQAPETPGVYQSNWKLRNSQGMLFGIGPGGSAPFWARIVVVPVFTDTPTIAPPPPTQTLTPQVFASGAVDLAADGGLDLDSGVVNQALNDDLGFVVTGQEQPQLLPENGARLAAFGSQVPEFSDCDSAEISARPIALQDLQPGDYFCFRTNEGLPGWLFLNEIETDRRSITLEFLTWAVP